MQLLPRDLWIPKNTKRFNRHDLLSSRILLWNGILVERQVNDAGQYSTPFRSTCPATSAHNAALSGANRCSRRVYATCAARLFPSGCVRDASTVLYVSCAATKKLM
jgi:hypothetical protein